MERTQTDQLIALLQAQRDEAAVRAGLARYSADWTESSDRLDGLNEQIMRLGANGSTSRELIGVGLEPEPDSRPVEKASSPGVGRPRMA